MKRQFRMAAFGVVVAAAISTLPGCAACSTVGYMYVDPAVIELDAPLTADFSLSACFGVSCEPATLTRSDGQVWEVPQEPPFAGDASLGDGSERVLRVVVTDAGGSVISEGDYEIPVTSESTGVFGQCPGPFVFEPVEITIPN